MHLNEINITEQTDIEPCDDIKISDGKDSLDEGNRLESTSIEISEEAKIDSVDLDGLSSRKSKLFNYKLPSVDFLNEEPDVQSDISDEVLRAKGQEIIDALATFGVSSELVGFEKGPVITMYKIEPAERGATARRLFGESGVHCSKAFFLILGRLWEAKWRQLGCPRAAL